MPLSIRNAHKSQRNCEPSNYEPTLILGADISIKKTYNPPSNRTFLRHIATFQQKKPTKDTKKRKKCVSLHIQTF